MLGGVVEKTLNGRRVKSGGRSLSMARRTRENIAILLFFLPLAFLIVKGWENFCAAGYAGLAAWLNVLVPSGLMAAALVIWPKKEPPSETE